MQAFTPSARTTSLSLALFAVKCQSTNTGPGIHGQDDGQGRVWDVEGAPRRAVVNEHKISQEIMPMVDRRVLLSWMAM